MSIASFPKNENKRGQAIVETAVVLLVIVLFTFGITEFGRVMYIKNMLNNAARAGARQAALTTWDGTPKSYPNIAYGSCSTTDQIEKTICSGLLYLQSPIEVSASVTSLDPSGNQRALSGDTVTVTVTLTKFTPVVSIMSSFISPTITGTASMRHE